MGPLIPPPPSEPSASERHGLGTGGILFALAFVVFSALIFTTHLKPRKTSAEAPPAPMPTLPLTYPPTRTVDASDTHFGVKVADPYRWLEDGKSPEVQAWLDAQNKLARSYLDALPGRAALEKRYAPAPPHRHDHRAGPRGRPLLLHEAQGEPGKGGPLLALGDRSERAGARADRSEPVHRHEQRLARAPRRRRSTASCSPTR